MSDTRPFLIVLPLVKYLVDNNVLYIFINLVCENIKTTSYETAIKCLSSFFFQLILLYFNLDKYKLTSLVKLLVNCDNIQ